MRRRINLKIKEVAVKGRRIGADESAGSGTALNEISAKPYQSAGGLFSQNAGKSSGSSGKSPLTGNKFIDLRTGYA